MSSHPPRRSRDVKALQRDPRRSSLFYFLRKRYDELAEDLAGPRPNWDALRDRAVRAKVTDCDNKEPSTRVVRLTWRKVESEAVKQRSAKTLGSKPEQQRSQRLAKGWQPPVVPVAATSTPRASVPDTPTTDRSSPDPDDGLTEEARAKLAALRRQLEWRDRFLHPPKLKE